MTSVQGCRRFQSVARRKTYRAVIFVLRLAAICTIFVFEQYAVSFHHSIVLSRPLEMAANIVINELLDNPLTVLQLRDKLRIVNKVHLLHLYPI